MHEDVNSGATAAVQSTTSADFAQKHLTLAQAAHLFADPPHPSALWRWCRKGLRARNGELVRLVHVRIGMKLYTTEEAIAEFGLALAEADVKATG
jgi:hypothetical protein